MLKTYLATGIKIEMIRNGSETQYIKACDLVDEEIPMANHEDKMRAFEKSYLKMMTLRMNWAMLLFKNELRITKQ